MSDSWVAAFPLARLPVGESRLFRRGRDAVAVFRLAEDELRAVDNRCPHEGYPLVQGLVKGCVLTCAWHNFKFDVRDGRSLSGEDAVRSWPVRVREGLVEIDVTEPDRSGRVPGLLRSLHEGLADHAIGRIARDVVRLLEADVSPVRLLVLGATFDATRAEWGPSHATAVAADVLGWLERYPGAQAALPVVQALDVAARSQVRVPARPVAIGTDPGGDAIAAGRRLGELVEAEDAAGAEALVRGALARGFGRAEIEPWLYALCAEHFLDFGHLLIYVNKAMNLLDAGNFADADPILPCLVFGMTNATREDTLPAWAGFRERMAAVGPELSRLASGPRRAPTAEEQGRIREAVLEGKAGEAFAAVEEAMSAHVDPVGIVDVLVACAAERLLRFDVAIDQDVGVQEGWLDVTHRLTFANAVRHALSRWPDPRAYKLVFQATRFIHAAKPLDEPAARRSVWSARAGTPAEVVAAICARDVRRAIEVASGCLDVDPEALRWALEDLVISDPFVRHIFVAHAIKTTVVAFEELRHVGPTPVLGLVRWLASGTAERGVRRQTLEALGLVMEGKVPKTLSL
jgi:nitrite reductase/ring-hydroxylating ferredoxin subunit